MPTSQNGWTVLTDRPPAVYVPGTGLLPGRLGVRLAVRAGDVATVLIEVARRFHGIEPIDVPVDESHGTRGVDDWGWAYRPVRGQDSGFSNHASGTAIDLNAVKHPRGVRGTFDNLTKSRILRMLYLFEDPRTGHSVVRWGELYSGTVDGMHFEINATPAQVARVADDIRHGRGRFAPPVTPESEDDMAMTPTERKALIDDIAAAVAVRQVPVMRYVDDVYRETDDTQTIAESAQHAAAQAYVAREGIARLEAQLAALTKLVQQLLADGGQPVTRGPA